MKKVLGNRNIGIAVVVDKKICLVYWYNIKFSFKIFYILK